MDLDFQQLATMEPEVARGVLPGFLAAYVDPDCGAAAPFEAAVHAALERTDDGELRELLERFAHAGDEYRLYPASAAARRISRACMSTLITTSEVSGLHHLEAAIGSPCLLLCNHLSYVDTQITDLLLYREAGAALADRLVTVAGPKVYMDPFRRIAAICLNTIKTAQSTHVSHNEAHLSPREVARIALETVRQAAEQMEQGRPVLLYGEGSRSRDGHLNPFLRAVSRYADHPSARVVPVAISGTHQLFPVERQTMRPASVRLTLCEGVEVAPIGARGAVEEAWRRIAAALPEHHRPHADTAPSV